MAQDNEEALRLLLILGQALLPSARHILLMAARVTSKAGVFTADAVRDRLDGHGKLGHVRNVGRLGGEVQTLDITDKIDREDIRALNRLCRRAGCGFAVTKLDTPEGTRTCLQFSRLSASTMEAVLRAAVGERILTQEDVDQAVADPDPAPGEMTLPMMGRDWKRMGADEWAHDFTTAAGERLHAVARADGSWEIHDPSIDLPHMLGNEVLAGAATDQGRDLGGAINAASAYIDALKSPEIMREHEQRTTSFEHMAQLKSKDVIKASKETSRRVDAKSEKRGLNQARAQRPERGQRPKPRR